MKFFPTKKTAPEPPRLKLGQRVRKERGVHRLGTEGIVVSLDTHVEDGVTYNLTIQSRTKTHRHTVHSMQNFFDPVIPEGAAPGSWDDCPWKPDHEHT